MITTQRELRRLFWEQNPTLNRRRIIYFGGERHHVSNTRMAWCDFVESMCRDGQISDELAQRATL